MRADEVRRIEFKQRLRGYHQEDVDNLVEKLAAELETSQPVQMLCASTVFRQTLRGYDVEEVDRFLAQASVQDTSFEPPWTVSRPLTSVVRSESSTDALPQPNPPRVLVAIYWAMMVSFVVGGIYLGEVGRVLWSDAHHPHTVGARTDVLDLRWRGWFGQALRPPSYFPGR